MKNLKYTVLLAFGITLLASCSATSHVVDDDVYVSKNPQMSSTEEVNDVSSYENYRYRRDRGDSDTRYRVDNRMLHTSIFIMGGMGNQFYNPYYNPYYGHNYYNGFYSPFYDPFYSPMNPYNNWSYGNYWTYSGFGYPSYGFYGSYYSPYGYGYGYNPYYYNNYYNNYYNPTPIGNVATNYNTHYGPRHSISGVNNGRRGQSPEVKGIALSNSGRNFSQADASTQAGKNVRTKETGSASSVTANGRSSNPVSRTSEAKGSRSVTSGTGLSRSGNTVLTHSDPQRGSGSYDINRSGGRGSVDVNRSNSDYNRPSRTFESGNSGTTRNSGGVSTSPRNSGGGGGGGATINRRGGH